MIGGKDIIIRTNPGPAVLDLAVRVIWRKWRDALLEDAVTGQRFETYRSLSELGIAGIQELLVYKDKGVADKWHELGADETLNGTMIHLLLSKAGLTMVVDSDPPAEVVSLVSAIQNGLKPGVFAFRRRSAA